MLTRPTRWGAAYLAFAVLPGVACHSGAAPSAVRLGEPFTLAPGDATLLEPRALRIGFSRVSADSRCPIDVTCVTAGDASVEVWLQAPSLRREMRVLSTATEAGRRTDYAGVSLRLEALAPAPRSGRRIAADEYRLTLIAR